MSEPANTRWQRRKEARPQEIIDAAMALFTRKGFAATKLDEVAQAAGVTKGTVYLYFSSKEALFVQAVQERVLPLLEMGENVIEQHTGSTADLLRCLLTEWMRALIGGGQCSLVKVMMTDGMQFPEIASFYYREVVLRSRRMFAGVLERGIARGEFRPVDIAISTRLIIAPVLMHNIWQHSFSELETQPGDPMQYVNQHIDLLLRGLQADAPAKPE